MGFFKGCLKAVGSVALGATGLASKVLEEVADAAGIDAGREFFNATKEASMNGIRAMWDDGTEERADTLDKIEDGVRGADEKTQGAARKAMANSALRIANEAKRMANKETDPDKKAALMEKYEQFMEKYEELNY